MKKKLAILMAAILTIGLLAVCTAAEETTEASEDGSGLTVWYIAKTRKEAMTTWVLSTFEKLVAENYPAMDLKVYDGEASFEKRTALFEDCIAQHPDMAIIQYYDDNEVPFIQDIIDAGIPVCVTNGQYNTAPGLCSFIDIKPYEQGAAVATAAAENLPEGAKVVIINGVAGNQHAEARKSAYHDIVIDARPDIELLAEAYCDWDRAKAMSTMEDWLQAFPEIDGVLTCYDEMGLGAMEALINADRLEGTQLYGTDALGGACLAIKAGLYTATVLQDGSANAKGAFKVMQDVLFNGNDEIQEIYCECPLIDASNVDDMIKTELEYEMISESDLEEYGWTAADFGM